MSGRSLRAAHASGVDRYSSSLAEMSAPASSRIAAHSTRVSSGRPRPSRPHVTWSSVARCQSGRFGSMPPSASRRRRISGVFEQVRSAGGQHRRHARAGVQQSHDEIALPECRRGREHAAAAGVRFARIGGDSPHHFVVFVQPDEVVAVEPAAAGHQQRAQLRRLGRRRRVPSRIDVRVRIGAVVEEELHHRAVAGARRRMERGSARRIGPLRPARIRAALQQEPSDRVVSATRQPRTAGACRRAARRESGRDPRRGAPSHARDRRGRPRR